MYCARLKNVHDLALLATPIIQPSEISEIQKPESAPQIKEIPILSYQAKPQNKIDYVAREQANQVLGLAGEQWIIEYEKRYLRKVRISGEILLG